MILNYTYRHIYTFVVACWCSSSVPNLWAWGCRFDSEPGHCQTLGKLFTHSASVHQTVPVKGRWRSATGKVTIAWLRTGYASQTQWSIHLRAWWPMYGRWAPHLCSRWATARFALPLTHFVKLAKMHVILGKNL